MAHVLWDASALAKRYILEVGSETVDAVFGLDPHHAQVATYLGYAETAVILLRKRNQGVLDAAEFVSARLLLEQEVLRDSRFDLLDLAAGDFLDSIVLADRHNLNVSDAAILVACLNYASAVPEPCVLVAADHRLLRAAARKGSCR